MAATLALDPIGLRRGAMALAVGGVLYAASPIHPTIPCPMLSLTGIPCPMCGMTRAVTSAFRLDFGASLRFNPAGLVIIAIAAWALVALRNRKQFSVPIWIPAVSFVALWAWNITLNPTFT